MNIHKLLIIMSRNRSRSRRKKLPEPEGLPSINDIDGLPKRYFKHYARQVYYLTLMGFTLFQVAQVFETNVETIYRWMRKYPEFADGVKMGKAIADGEVAHSLYKRALGYSHPHQVILTNRIREYDNKGKIVREYTEPLIVDTVKHYPPDTAAATKWLRARQPEVWGNKLEVKGKITMHHEVDLTGFTNEELEVLSKLSLARENPEDVEFEEV